MPVFLLCIAAIALLAFGCTNRNASVSEGEVLRYSRSTIVERVKKIPNSKAEPLIPRKSAPLPIPEIAHESSVIRNFETQHEADNATDDVWEETITIPAVGPAIPRSNPQRPTSRDFAELAPPEDTHTVRTKHKITKFYCPSFADTESTYLMKWISKVQQIPLPHRSSKKPACGDVVSENLTLTADLQCGPDTPVALTLMGNKFILNGNGHSIQVASTQQTALLILGTGNKIKNLTLQGGKPGLGIVSHEKAPTNWCGAIKEMAPEISQAGTSQSLFARAVARFRSWLR